MQEQQNLSSIWHNPIHFIACGFGLGALPIMPGTFGSMGGIILYLILIKLFGTFYIVITFLLILLGIFLCGKFNKDLGTEDHPAAVWDELASFPIVMLGIPNKWWWILLGFILFRIFDIVKPYPICWVDKNIHGGFGVMLDDVLAALISWLILLCCFWLLRTF